MLSIGKINELYLQGVDLSHILSPPLPSPKPKVVRPKPLSSFERALAAYKASRPAEIKIVSVTLTIFPPEDAAEQVEPVTEPVPVKQVDLFKIYHKEVWKLTEQQPLHTLEGCEKRGFRDHHLDHKTSVWYGFKNNIPAEEIAHISNLRFIPYKDNMLKGRKCLSKD